MTNQQYSCCVCICKRGFKCVYVGLFSSVARQCRKSQKQPVIRSKNRKYLQLKPSILTIATRIPTPLESFYGHRNGHCTILIPLLFWAFQNPFPIIFSRCHRQNNPRAPHLDNKTANTNIVVCTPNPPKKSVIETNNSLTPFFVFSPLYLFIFFVIT